MISGKLNQNKVDVTFRLSDENVSTICIHNDNGIYTKVNLNDYEISEFTNEEYTKTLPQGEGTIRIYDGVGNYTVVSVGPKVISLNKLSTDQKVVLKATDANSKITKITQTIDGEPLVMTSGSLDKNNIDVEFELLSDGQREIYIHNEAGVCTKVNIGQYETDHMEYKKVYNNLLPAAGESMEGNIRIYDGVGNYTVASVGPKVISLRKMPNDGEVILAAKDLNSDIVKITKTPDGDPISVTPVDTTSNNPWGKNIYVKFQITDSDKIYIHNNDRVYTKVMLSDYETDYMGQLKTYNVSIPEAGEIMEGDIRIHDGVGNYTVASIGPKIVSLEQYHGGTTLTLEAETIDNTIHLSKITEDSPTGNEIDLSGQSFAGQTSATVTFDINENTTTIYVHDDKGIYTKVNLGGYEISITTTVNLAIKNQANTKMLVDVFISSGGTGTILSVDYLDANDQGIGDRVILDAGTESFAGIKTIPYGTASFRLNYSDGTSYIVVLSQDDGRPVASDIYKMPDGKISITLEDSAGIDKIEYYQDGTLQSPIVINPANDNVNKTKNPTKVIKALDLPTNRILVYDTFGDVTAVDLDYVLKVNRATTNGTSVSIDIESEKPIASITYGNGQPININGSLTTYSEVRQISGVTEFTVTYSDNTSDKVGLTTDEQQPNVIGEYILNERVVILVSDESGIGGIKYGNSDTLNEIPVMREGKLTFAKDIATVKLYDTLGTEKTKEIDTSTMMEVNNIYKVPSGEIKITTSRIASVAYYNLEGVLTTLTQATDYTLPSYVKSIYIKANVNDTGIEVELPNDIPVISKVVKNTENNALYFETSKTITSVRCIGSTSGSTIPSNQITNGVMTLDAGTTSIEITYNDSTKNILALTQDNNWSGIVIDETNMYKSGDYVIVDVASNAGLTKVSYDNASPINLGGVISKRLEVPINVATITVYDPLNTEGVTLNIGTCVGSLASFKNIYKDKAGNIHITTNEVLYYEGNDTGVTGDVVIPANKTQAWTKDGDNVKLTLDLSNVVLKVNKAVINSSKTKIAIDVESDKEISSIAFYNSLADNVEAVETKPIARNTINDVIRVPEGTRCMKFLYQGGEGIKVVPSEYDGIPKLISLTQSEEGKILLTVSDDCGIYKMAYQNSNGSITVVDVDDNQTFVTKELTIPEDVKQIMVYNVFGKAATVNIGDAQMEVKTAKVNASGEKALLELLVKDATITSIQYKDRDGELHNVSLENNEALTDGAKKYSGVLDGVNGANAVIVTYLGEGENDEPISVTVPLAIDNMPPTLTNVYRKYKSLSVEMEDVSGIAKIVDDNGKELEIKANKNVAIDDGVTKVYVYDRLDNMATVVLSECAVIDSMYQQDGKLYTITSGITKIGGEDVDVGGAHVFDIPDATQEVMLTKQDGNTIKLSLSDVPEVDKLAIRNNKIRVTSNKTIERIMCYNDTPRELESNITNVAADALVNVPVGTTNVRIIYNDLTSSSIAPTVCGNTTMRDKYISEEGILTFTLENVSGVYGVKYTVEQTPSNDYTDNSYTLKSLGGIKSVSVDVPSGATKVVSINGFGDIEEIYVGNTATTWPQSNVPSLSNIQKNKDDQVVIETSATIYYEGGSASPVAGKVTLPEGVDEFYTKVGDERQTTLYTKDVVLKVSNAVVSDTEANDKKKVAINVDVTKDVAKLICCGSSGDTLDEISNLSGLIDDGGLNSVIEVPKNTETIKVQYVDGRTNIIRLDTYDATQFTTSDSILLEDGSNMVTLKSMAGIKSVTYTKDNQTTTIPIEGNPVEIVQKIPKGAQNIQMVDMFEEAPKTVDLSNPETTISSHAVGASGDKALLKISSDKVIRKIEYVNRDGVKTEIALEGNETSYNNVLEVNGANEIVVTYEKIVGNETITTKSTIELKKDEIKPNHKSVLVNGDATECKMELNSKRGIAKIRCGGKELTLAGNPENVAVVIKVKHKAQSLDVGMFSALDEPANETVTITRVGDVVTIEVDDPDLAIMFYDSIDNESILTMTLLEEEEDTVCDDEGPEYSLSFHEGKYILTLWDNVTGLKDVRNEANTTTIHAISGNPQVFITEETALPNANDDNVLIAYDGFGNTTRIELPKNNGDGPNVLWAYKSEVENCIYAGVEDERGIEKVVDQDGKDRMWIKDTPKSKVIRYKLNKDDTYFTVKDIFGKGTNVIIEEISLDVTSAYKNLEGDKIVLEMEDKDHGIGNVTYLNGIVIPEITASGVRDKQKYTVLEGTTAIKVYRNDDNTKFAIVQLDVDVESPEVPGNESEGRLYRRGTTSPGVSGGYVVIRAVDNKAGVDTIVAGSNTLELGLSKEVLAMISIEDATKVVITDGVGNVKEIPVQDITRDETGPSAQIDYNRTQNNYTLTITDSEAGVWKVVKNNDAIIATYKDYLAGENVDGGRGTYPNIQTITLDTMIGINKIEVYDAVGNKTEVNLNNVLCIVNYAYQNREGTRLAVNIQDIRGITKIGIFSASSPNVEKTIEKFAQGTTAIRRYYSIDGVVQDIKIYSTGGYYTLWENVEEYIGGIEVSQDVAYSLVGIRQIDYEDGTSIEFRGDIPVKVKVDKVNHTSVKVHDTLGNVVEI